MLRDIISNSLPYNKIHKLCSTSGELVSKGWWHKQKINKENKRYDSLLYALVPYNYDSLLSNYLCLIEIGFSTVDKPVPHLNYQWSHTIVSQTTLGLGLLHTIIQTRIVWGSQN